MLTESALTTLQLRNEERFQNVEDILETPEEIKAYFLKLMPNIDIGEGPVQTLELRVDQNVFCNASACAVVGASTPIKGQNFITLKPFPNERPNFRAKAQLIDGVYKVPKHSEFIATVMESDPNQMHFGSKS